MYRITKQLNISQGSVVMHLSSKEMHYYDH